MEYINAIKIIHKTSGGDGWFGSTHNMNIYKGCNQGCIYCDSRSSCYQIQDFDIVKPKKDADIKIESELKSKRTKGIISMGGMSDPYNSLEKNLKLTRSALESIQRYGFGVSCITKNTLLERDIDIYKKINQTMPVTIGVTITTANDLLQSRIERNVPSSSERFQLIQKCAQEGLFSGVLMMPILPFINDTIENIENIVLKAKESGAKFIYPSFGVTLRDNQRLHFFGKIGEKLTKQYIQEFQENYMCTSPNHKELKKRFIQLCEQHNILYKMKDIIAESKTYIKQEQISFGL